MERIVFLERNTFQATFRRPQFDHEWIEHGETTREQIVERLRKATIAICNKLPLHESELSELPDLKLIGVAATGTDNIDLRYCKNRGIAVSNVRDYAVYSLPEHVLMLMLVLRRNLFSYAEDVRNGEWQKAKQFCLLNHPIHDLYRSKIAINGYGSLGKAVEALAKAIGMQVIIAERKNAQTTRAGRTEFAEALRLSDVVTLHCPLTEETRDLIGAAEFQLMKKEAILINTARGGLVNELALVEALNTDLIGGAGVDVLTEEPPRDGNVLLEQDLPNLIVTPQIAWASREAMQVLADQLIDNIEAFIGGTPENLVA